LSEDDQKKIEEIKNVKKEVGEHIEKFELHLGAEKAYHYFWHTFADKIIEEAKPRLKGEDEEDKQVAVAMLLEVLEEALVMLHPFVPFITEEVFSLIHPGKLLLIHPWNN